MTEKVNPDWDLSTVSFFMIRPKRTSLWSFSHLYSFSTTVLTFLCFDRSVHLLMFRPKRSEVEKPWALFILKMKRFLHSGRNIKKARIMWWLKQYYRWSLHSVKTSFLYPRSYLPWNRSLWNTDFTWLSRFHVLPTTTKRSIILEMVRRPPFAVEVVFDDHLFPHYLEAFSASGPELWGIPRLCRTAG